MENWFSILNADVLDTPALVVYPERVKHNISVLKAAIDNPGRLRPHVKTHKCKEAVLLNLDAGIHKFKCATIAEAEMLGTCAAADVLLAYQPVGPKMNRFINLVKKYKATKFSCLVDNAETAAQLSQVAVVNELVITVYIDLNVGMNRSGIVPQRAFELYQACLPLQGIRVVGLHAYDGHIHDASLEIRTGQCNTAFAPVDELVEQLNDIGFNPVVIAGGSPTFAVHVQRKQVECSPGTFIYWDWGYGAFKENDFLTAALVVGRVISLPGDNTICVDIGHKSIASENSLTKRITFLNAPELVPVSQSEEHLVLDAGPGHNYRVGSLLYGLPYHICPTVALYERAITIMKNHVAGEWKTLARDRQINF